jgi:hypothetical protein
MHVLGERMAHLRLVCGMAKATGTDVVRAFDYGDLSSEEWAEMVETCRGCEAADACAHWLADAPHWDEAPGVCLNQKRFAALRKKAEDTAPA